MSNRSNSPALHSNSLPVSAATTLATASSKHLHCPGTPANPSAPLHSVSYISTRCPVAHVRGQWPHTSPQCAVFPTKSSNQSAHSARTVRPQPIPSASVGYVCAKR